MSTAAKPALALVSSPSVKLAPAAIFLSDIVALELSFVLGLGVRQLLGDFFTASIGVNQFLGVAAGILLLPLIYYQLGLYPGYLLGPVERLRRRTLATLFVFGGLMAWDYLVERGILSRGVLLATLVFALILPPLLEMFTRRWLIRLNRWGIRVWIAGAGKQGRTIARTLLAEPEHGLIPVGFLQSGTIPTQAPTYALDGLPILNLDHAGPALVDSADAAIVCLADLADHQRRTAGLDSVLQRLRFPRVIVVPDLAGVASLWVQARDLGGTLGFEIKKNLLLRHNHILKSAMDQAVALPLFLLSLPIMALAGACIKLLSPGPIFYRQMREGIDGARIPVWKLRTMHTDGKRILDEWFETHPEDERHWKRHFKLPQDPRVIPFIGRLLRRTSLDELPQLWSVLRGEMSLVGPRPLPDYHLNGFDSAFRQFRTQVLPGLTGLWQVSSRADGDTDVLRAMDTFYIRNWSPWLDLYILARTVTAVLLARGAY